MLADIQKAGSVVISFVSSPTATWTCLILLLSVHLATNHAAVRAVRMHSLNRQRANLVLSHLIDSKEVPTPEMISYQERIYEWDGVLRWRGGVPIAKARIGITMQEFVNGLGPAHYMTGAVRDRDSILQTLIKLYKDEDFLLWYHDQSKTAYIVLKEGAPAKAHLKAWAIGLCVAHRLHNEDATSATTDRILEVLAMTLDEVAHQWTDCITKIEAAGWDVDIASLETSSGTRICLHEKKVWRNYEKKQAPA